jgi:hypothetical protein
VAQRGGTDGSGADGFRSALAALFVLMGGPVQPDTAPRGGAATGESSATDGQIDSYRGAACDEAPTARATPAPETAPASFSGQTLKSPGNAEWASATMLMQLRQQPAAGEGRSRDELAVADARGRVARAAAVAASASAAMKHVAFDAVITDTKATPVADDKRAPEIRPVIAAAEARDGRDSGQRSGHEDDSRIVRKRQAETPEVPAVRIVPAEPHAEVGEIAAVSDRMAPDAASQRNRAPESASAQRTPAVEQIAEPRAEPLGVRHLRLQVAPDPARPVQLLVAERAGAVHVSVRANDADTAGVLRGDLQRLVADLERSGLRAETSAPAPSSRDATHAVEATLFARSEPEARHGHQGYRRQDEAPPRNRKKRGHNESAAFNLDFATEAIR